MSLFEVAKASRRRVLRVLLIKLFYNKSIRLNRIFNPNFFNPFKEKSEMKSYPIVTL